MIKKVSCFACVLFLLSVLAQCVLGADSSKLCVNNIWRPGQYVFNQECFVSLITSVQKDVLSKSQTQVRFTWNAELLELENGGVQKMKLNATHVSLRYEENGAEAASYDSANNSLNKPFVNDVFQHFMNAKISVVFKNGLVQEVAVNDDVWDGLAKPSNEEEKAFFEHFQSLPTKANLSQIFDPLGWIANPKEVGVQEEWKNEVPIQFPVVGDKILVWDCKLNSMKKNGSLNLAEVVGNANLDFELEEQKIAATVKSEVKASFNSQNGSPWGLEAKTTVTAVQASEKDNDADVKIASYQRNSLRVARR